MTCVSLFTLMKSTFHTIRFIGLFDLWVWVTFFLPSSSPNYNFYEWDTLDIIIMIMTNKIDCFSPKSQMWDLMYKNEKWRVDSYLYSPKISKSTIYPLSMMDKNRKIDNKWALQKISNYPQIVVWDDFTVRRNSYIDHRWQCAYEAM